jgi:hypothetical protein
MPVEIKEMVIKALIQEKGGGFPEGLSEIIDGQQKSASKLSYAEKEEIIEACVQRVLKELERQRRSV